MNKVSDETEDLIFWLQVGGLSVFWLCISIIYLSHPLYSSCFPLHQYWYGETWKNSPVHLILLCSILFTIYIVLTTRSTKYGSILFSFSILGLIVLLSSFERLNYAIQELDGVKITESSYSEKPPVFTIALIYIFDLHVDVSPADWMILKPKNLELSEELDRNRVMNCQDPFRGFGQQH